MLTKQQAQRFNQNLLKWFDQYGRHDLPWQKNMTSYRVWVSEIMLQQTQVKTVIPYYLNFMRQFPNIKKLAAAPIDEVLHLWTGLGYYARARNLHQCAQVICEQYKGRFPNQIEQVMALPGIGQSTAGAILALSKNLMFPILDGNVKRVLCRYLKIEGWPEKNDVKQKLWKIAERLTPGLRVADYTQAIMDLGATVCTRTQPSCDVCPMKRTCQAKRDNEVQLFPFSKPKTKQPVRSTKMLLICNQAQQIYLEKRPPSGIWGGLWGFPECTESEDVIDWCAKKLGMIVKSKGKQKQFRHTFSHFHLDITPVTVEFIDFEPQFKNQIREQAESVWYHHESDLKLGFATPVKRLLNKLVVTKLTGAKN